MGRNKKFRERTYKGHQNIDKFLSDKNLQRKPIAKDGSCLFRAVAEQVFSTQFYHHVVRMQCVEYIQHHQDDFREFITMSIPEYLDYLKRELWGGEVELVVVSKLYNRSINVFVYNEVEGTVQEQVFSSSEETTSISSATQETPIMLAYSGGNHYDIVYSTKHMENMAFCQSIVYELFVTSVFKDRIPIPCLKKLSTMQDEDLEELHRVQSRDIPVQSLDHPSRLLYTHYPVEVIEAMGENTYRNTALDVHKRAKANIEQHDRHFAASIQFQRGDDIVFRIGGQEMEGEIARLNVSAACHLVFVPKIREEWEIPAKDIVLKHTRQSNGRRQHPGGGVRSRAIQQSHSGVKQQQQVHIPQTQSTSSSSTTTKDAPPQSQTKRTNPQQQETAASCTGSKQQSQSSSSGVKHLQQSREGQKLQAAGVGGGGARTSMRTQPPIQQSAKTLFSSGPLVKSDQQQQQQTSSHSRSPTQIQDTKSSSASPQGGGQKVVGTVSGGGRPTTDSRTTTNSRVSMMTPSAQDQAGRIKLKEVHKTKKGDANPDDHSSSNSEEEVHSGRGKSKLPAYWSSGSGGGTSGMTRQSSLQRESQQKDNLSKGKVSSDGVGSRGGNRLDTQALLKQQHEYSKGKLPVTSQTTKTTGNILESSTPFTQHHNTTMASLAVPSTSIISTNAPDKPSSPKLQPESESLLLLQPSPIQGFIDGPNHNGGDKTSQDSPPYFEPQLPRDPASQSQDAWPMFSESTTPLDTPPKPHQPSQLFPSISTTPPPQAVPPATIDSSNIIPAPTIHGSSMMLKAVQQIHHQQQLQQHQHNQLLSVAGEGSGGGVDRAVPQQRSPPPHPQLNQFSQLLQHTLPGNGILEPNISTAPSNLPYFNLNQSGLNRFFPSGPTATNTLLTTNTAQKVPHPSNVDGASSGGGGGGLLPSPFTHGLPMRVPSYLPQGPTAATIGKHDSSTVSTNTPHTQGQQSLITTSQLQQQQPPQSVSTATIKHPHTASMVHSVSPLPISPPPAGAVQTLMQLFPQPIPPMVSLPHSVFYSHAQASSSVPSPLIPHNIPPLKTDKLEQQGGDDGPPPAPQPSAAPSPLLVTAYTQTNTPKTISAYAQACVSMKDSRIQACPEVKATKTQTTGKFVAVEDLQPSGFEDTTKLAKVSSAIRYSIQCLTSYLMLCDDDENASDMLSMLKKLNEEGLKELVEPSEEKSKFAALDPSQQDFLVSLRATRTLTEDPQRALSDQQKALINKSGNTGIAVGDEEVQPQMESNGVTLQQAATTLPAITTTMKSQNDQNETLQAVLSTQQNEEKQKSNSDVKHQALQQEIQQQRFPQFAMPPQMMMQRPPYMMGPPLISYAAGVYPGGFPMPGVVMPYGHHMMVPMPPHPLMNPQQKVEQQQQPQQQQQTKGGEDTVQLSSTESPSTSQVIPTTISPPTLPLTEVKDSVNCHEDNRTQETTSSQYKVSQSPSIVPNMEIQSASTLLSDPSAPSSTHELQEEKEKEHQLSQQFPEQDVSTTDAIAGASGLQTSKLHKTTTFDVDLASSTALEEEGGLNPGLPCRGRGQSSKSKMKKYNLEGGKGDSHHQTTEMKQQKRAKTGRAKRLQEAAQQDEKVSQPTDKIVDVHQPAEPLTKGNSDAILGNPPATSSSDNRTPALQQHSCSTGATPKSYTGSHSSSQRYSQQSGGGRHHQNRKQNRDRNTTTTKPSTATTSGGGGQRANNHKQQQNASMEGSQRSASREIPHPHNPSRKSNRHRDSITPIQATKSQGGSTGGGNDSTRSHHHYNSYMVTTLSKRHLSPKSFRSFPLSPSSPSNHSSINGGSYTVVPQTATDVCTTTATKNLAGHKSYSPLLTFKDSPNEDEVLRFERVDPELLNWSTRVTSSDDHCYGMQDTDTPEDPFVSQAAVSNKDFEFPLQGDDDDDIILPYSFKNPLEPQIPGRYDCDDDDQGLINLRPHVCTDRNLHQWQ